METVWDRVEDDWHGYVDLAKEKWPRIDPDILTRTNGRRDALIDAVERAYDVSREQARREVTYWLTTAPAERAARADRRAESRSGRPSGQQFPSPEQGGEDIEGWQAIRSFAAQGRAHPVSVMLVAVGVGLLVARFARGR